MNEYIATNARTTGRVKPRPYKYMRSGVGVGLDRPITTNLERKLCQN